MKPFENKILFNTLNVKKVRGKTECFMNVQKLFNGVNFTHASFVGTREKEKTAKFFKVLEKV